MATAEVIAVQKIQTAPTARDLAKQVLLDEARLALDINQHGIRYDKAQLAPFQDPLARGFGFFGSDALSGFDLPHGVSARGRYHRWTPFSLRVEEGKPVLFKDEAPVGEVRFHKGYPTGEKLLSSGEKVSDIVSITAQGGLHVMYSNECSLKDQGEDCLYCGFNERAKDGTRKVLLKTPRQVAEAYQIARRDGLGNHVRLTGGFVPERRELEYYLDVADAIHETYSSFYGAAIIGAPADLAVIPRYKEAGYEHISTNIEVWDHNIFAAMCPGKEKRNGGWQHWLDALEYAVDVFGRGNVHSTIVGGLEPKESSLEGIEYLAAKGIVCHFSIFHPEKGTPLEGYRSPEAWWHWELLDKATDIYRRYGFNTLQLYSGPASGPHSATVFRIKNGDFEGNSIKPWTYPSID